MRDSLHGGPKLGELGFVPRLASLLARLVESVTIKRKRSALKLCESLSLGERRFLAIVQCEEHRFLVGVTNQSITLLQQLAANAPQQPSARDERNMIAGGESA